ncbi:hypothetical protein UACE39S_05217 [Ureibacillus acetophenoni]
MVLLKHSSIKIAGIRSVDDDGRKKEYMITSLGKEMIEYEISRLKELYDNGIRITRGDNH